MTPKTRLTNHLSHYEFVVFGHRGAAGLAPENTLPSFQAALQWAVPMIELDVHRVYARDHSEHLAVIHDADLSRTTNGRGRITDHSLEDLAALDAGLGQPVPTLPEVLELLATHNAAAPHPVGLNIELKGPDTSRKVAELIADQALPLLVSSFDHDQLRLFHAIAPDIPVAPLFGKWNPSCWEIAAQLRAPSVNWSSRIVTPARVGQANERGLKVFVYTVNDPQHAADLSAMGAAGIFTDRPDRMSRWLTYA